MRRFLGTTLRTCGLTLLALVLCSAAAHAQRVVGRVVDAASGTGIADVEVRVISAAGATARAVSDTAGHFTVRVTGGTGRYRLTATHLRYATTNADVELRETDQVEVIVRMAETALELPPLDVIAVSRAPDPFLERAGYYDRKQGRFGVFIDPEDIERRRPLNTSDLFRNINGVRVIMLGGVRGNDIRITRGEDPNCPPRVYIDRVMVRAGGRQSRPDDPPIDALIQATNLYAIEVYRSPTEIPTEFAGNYVTCGVVLIWTRRGAQRD